MNYLARKQYSIAKKYIKNGEFDLAQNIINKMLADGMEDPEILTDVSLLYVAMNQPKIAAVYIRHAFDLEKSVKRLEYMANINYDAGKYELSAPQYEELLKYKQENIIYSKCIESYKKLDIYSEAINIAKMYDHAAQTVESLSNLIYIYIEVGMEQESIDACDELVRRFPNSSLTSNTLGFLYECIYNDYETAKKYFKKAANQGFIDAYYNLGVCCKQSEDFVNAEKYLKRLASLRSDTKVDYNYTLGSVYLAQRKLRLGYKYYGNRVIARVLNKQRKKHLWDGKEYPNDILYVSSEQGFGDNIQFLRYIPLAAEKFRKVIYAPRPELLTLFKDNFAKEKYSNIEIVSDDEVVRSHKFSLIMDLPHKLHMTFHNIPSTKRYLESNKRKREMYKTNYFNTDKFKIGLNWRAKGMGLRDAVFRTIDAPYYFKDFINNPDSEFYSFQMGDIFDMLKKYPHVKDIANTISDFSDTAAALDNLDVLVTVDTALAHLAGAMGIKTYLLLCHAPDWRWFDNDEKTEWYPSITIIKQKDRRTWNDVAETLNKYLKKDIEKFKKSKKTSKSKTVKKPTKKKKSDG